MPVFPSLPGGGGLTFGTGGDDLIVGGRGPSIVWAGAGFALGVHTSARIPVPATASTTRAGGTSSAEARTVMRPLRMSKASRPSPTTGPTARLRTATSSAQSRPVIL